MNREKGEGNRGARLRRVAQGVSESVLINHWKGKCIQNRAKSVREGARLRRGVI